MALAFRCKVDTQQREVKKWEFVVSHNGISRKLTFEVEVFRKQDAAITNTLTGLTAKQLQLIITRLYLVKNGIISLSNICA